jgi:DnaJ family protein C protein 3
MNNHKKAHVYCDEALTLYKHSLHGLLSLAQRQMDAENYEECIRTLNLAKEHHPSASQIQGLMQKAEVALKRSKSKDYYKILNVANDADERQIKHAYRKMTKEYHPDKRHKNGVSKEEAEKKMASINEAYEVLSDPELRARFDRGDDPNSHERQQAPFQGNPFGNGQPFVFQQGGQRQGGQQFNFKFGGGGGGGFPFGM